MVIPTIKKNIWVRTSVLSLILISATQAYSQVPQSHLPAVEMMQDIAGRPFFPRTYEDVNGNPYLFDDFQYSTVTLANGQVLKDIKTNINLMTNELLYIDEKGATMAASNSAVKSIDVDGKKFIQSPAKNAYCQVISTEGKATLLRIYKKRILETKAYNSATIQKDFKLVDSDVIVFGEKLTEVRSANDLYQVLTPSENLREFAKTEKLKAKSEDSWIKIVNHYNAI